jgi:hypothetical protein
VLLLLFLLVVTFIYLPVGRRGERHA